MRAFKTTFLLLALLVSVLPQENTPVFLEPIETTKDTLTSYSIIFTSDTPISHEAKIRITFPFEFDPRQLISFSKCEYKKGNEDLQENSCTLDGRSFILDVGSISIDTEMTVVIGDILNPKDAEISSNFVVETLFLNVVVTKNEEFGRTSFTSSPVDSGANLLVYNYENTLIEQGSSWVFEFTLSTTYPSGTTIRLVFPQGFSSHKVQCNITGIIDTDLKTRTFPKLNVYDCLNIQSQLSGSQKIILSGIVNPDYEISVSDIELHVLQPNNRVILERIRQSSSTVVNVDHKDMNVSINIPNKFRNNSIEYIFEINMDSDFSSEDKLQLVFDGNWTFFTEYSSFIEGILSDDSHTPSFSAIYDHPTYSTLQIKNFSAITRQRQVAFTVSMKTPLDANNYNLAISGRRSHGGLVEQYTQTLQINDTTGYIRQMRLHPMIQGVKLPVGQTGPLEIILGLRNNLPQTNVLTYGKFIIQITPNLPKPDVAINGVPKCYFYGDIEAKNCTYDATDPLKTVVEVFTPIDFNFQSSQIPFTLTTEGFIDEEYQGITIDSLVKRYKFEIQFYTDYREEPIPTEVIFGDWVADPIQLSDSFSCTTMTKGQRSWDHLECTFTTPSQILSEPSFIHIFRIQFTASNPSQVGWHPQLGYSSNHIYPDYPCIGYGANLNADPYIKCDLVTWTSGPYQSQISEPYINIYGFEQLPANSTITVEIPLIKRQDQTYETQLRFSIIQDTYGFSSDFITLYSQVVDQNTNHYVSSSNDDYDAQTISHTLTNPHPNKVTDITLNSYDLGVAGVTHVILEVDQTHFEDIGRGHHIACGSHLCSKFNKPVQYFILHPQTTLSQVQTLTFPSIVTPPYSGTFQFRLRLYKDNSYVRHSYFSVTIDPEPIPTPTYDFHQSLAADSNLYPYTNKYFSISLQTVNNLVEGSEIQIVLDNYLTFASDYCVITGNISAADGRGVQCHVSVGSDTLYLRHFADLNGGTDIQVDIELTTTTSTSSITPTVSIKTTYSNGNIVDQIQNSPFSSAPISNTNRKTFTKFQVANPQTVERKPSKGYFSHLLFIFKPRLSSTVTDGYHMVFTFTNDFYPYSNALNLPLICEINSVRHDCSYTLTPFQVTISSIANDFTTNDNYINITTEYLDHNGIHYPQNQGKYLLQAEIHNWNYTELYERVQQYVDILPGTVAYFNATYAHRDIGRHNIFTFQFRNGDDIIPAYDDGTTAGRIYIGFPTKDQNNNNVFADNLGFSEGLGTVIPCWFENGAGYITPIAGQNLQCMLRTSPFTPNYVVVEIINFDTVAAGTDVKVVMGKIMNPNIQKYDVNFMVQVNTMTVSSRQEQQLYESYYNMFFNMLSPSISSRTESDSTTTMFQPGSKVGDLNKYINKTPYTGSGSFSTGDWYIVDMDDEFELEGNVGGCLSPYYEECIVFKEINWLAVKIGNTTLQPLQVYVTKLPTSISRVDTTYEAFTFKSERWSETITYTITAAHRWMELRGSISAFSFEVLGSHDKLNIEQKNVQVLVSFNVSHVVNRQGTIQIQFPNNNNLVPSIKPHCRSAVTLASQLHGDPTGKPASNVQGQVGCLVQNSYSWVITSFDELPAGSQVKILGNIDFPLEETASLGMGWVATYGDTHSSNVFDHGRTIDFLSTNFPLQVRNKTWNLDADVTMYSSEPLRAGHKGQLRFKLAFATTLSGISGGGYVDISLWKYNTMYMSGGFSGPTSNLVCTIKQMNNNEIFGCEVTSASSQTNYYTYRLQSFENLAANVDYEFMLTTQNGDANEGINFPGSHGVHKVQIQMKYSSGNSQQVGQAHFVEVYGAAFKVANFISTVDIPEALNMILLEFIPYNTISTNEQFVIEIPTISIDGQSLITGDLGMGYEDYDDLQFDLYESSISSMDCKVYTGDLSTRQPVKIVCSNFNTAITNTMAVKMGFWIKNPSTIIGLSIPVQIYSFDTYRARKDTWSLIQAGIKVLPTSQSPISDTGNFDSSSAERQISGQHLTLTTRNTKPLQQGDLYILKFNFDLRNEQLQAGSFKYNSGYASTGDVIFMRNCKTIILRVGSTALATMTSGTSSLNAKIQSVFYNPSIQLTTEEKKIEGFAIYLSSDDSQLIPYTDGFIDLVPRQISNPSFTFSAINSNQKKGQREDYYISFTYSTSSSAADMALVKKISVEFPCSATDMTFEGTQCIDHASSNIEIDHCIIDASTCTMWITPFEKTSYINSHSFQVQTKGLAIRNPVSSGSINKNQFVISYYTWEGDAEPVLSTSSTDYVFFKQDSTRISSSSLSYSNTYRNPHTDVSVPREVYVNEFEPASTDLGNNRMKTPLQFKFKVMTTFNDLSSSNNYHQIRVDFDTYYTHPSLNQNSNDLYKYVPTCELNGQRIEDCSISGGKIIMKFQHNLVNGEEAAVRFSVLNPTNEADDGFYISNLNNPTVTLPIEFLPYGGTNYYGQAQPFHTFHRVSGSYPQLGIYSATVTSGTPVFGKMNYLEFSLSFSRSDINGLVLEIPVVNEDGTKIYNDPTLMNLPSGSQYPCSVGIDTNVYCYYEKGSSTDYGRPTRIYITQFSVQGGNTLSLRMLFTNPDILGVFPSFIFKAFGGSYSAPQLMGDELMGRYKIIDPFKTYPQVGYTSTGTCQANPNRGLWNKQTVYDFYINHAQNANSYVIAQWVLEHSTYGQLSQYEVVSSYIRDYFTISYSPTDRKLYMVKKLGSYYSGGSNYHRFGYLRQKHFHYNSYTVHLLKQPNYSTITCTISQSYLDTHREVNEYGTPYIERVDTEDRYTTGSGWIFMSVYMGTVTTSTILDDDDPADFVVAVKFTGGYPYTSFGSSHECLLEQGLTSTDELKPVTCEIESSTNQIIFRNVNKFTQNILKFYFVGTTPSSSFTGTTVEIRAYANSQSYAGSDGWALFRGSTSGYTMVYMYYTSGSHSSTSAPSIPSHSSIMFSSSWVETSGYTKVMSYSSTSIKMRVYRGAAADFSNVYRMTFRFYTQRLTPSGCTGVSFTSNRYSSNHKSLTSCGASSRHFWAIYNFYSTGGNSWPYWYAGDYYDFTFTFSSVSGDVSSNSIWMFGHTTITWQQSIYHHSDHGKCGCCGNCCSYTCCCQHCCGDYDDGHCQWTYCCNNCCCAYHCCVYCSCRWYYSFGTFMLTGRTTPGYAPEIGLFSSGSVDLVSKQKSVQTELMVQGNSFQISVGPSYGSSILIHFDGQTYPNTNPFPATDHTEIGAEIDCKCLVGSSISQSYSTSYLTPKCVRYIPTGMEPSIGVFLDVASGQSMRCYFPGYLSSSSNSKLNVDIMRMIELHHRRSSRRGNYWDRYIKFNIEQTYNTAGTSGSLSVSENNFWTSAESYSSRYYEINMTGYNTNQPTIYMAMYMPKPTTSFCAYSSFYSCRIYTSFINRRYFVVAHWTGTTTTIRFNGTVYFPPADDISSSFYSTYIGFTETGSERYYHIWSTTRSTSILSPSTPSYSYKPAIYGSNLNGYPSTFLVTANLNGNTLYSFRRYSGQYEGSFLRLQMTGFTTLYGCGVTLSNRPLSLTAPFYCQVKSSNYLDITAKEDISMTGTIYITIYTASVPNSVTYKLTLYDKYLSGSDYSKSVYLSATFSRTASYTVLQPTAIKWRKQVFKEFRSSSGPIRIILNHNYQYVYDYDTNSNSDAILVYYPGGISSSYTYMCFLKEYQPGKRYLYREHEAKCFYHSSNTIRIESIPSYTINPNYYYELTIYRNNNGAQAYLTTSTSDTFLATVQTTPTLAGSSIVNEDFLLVERYRTVYPIVLNSIYILTRQAAATNSLYVSFTVNKAGSSFQYFEFEFDNLGLSSFEKQNGDQIPCYLSGDFNTIGGKSQQPICKGYTSDTDQDSPLKIRVLRFASFSSGTTFEIAFDNFNNPSLQELFLVPINMRITYFDRSNNDVHTSNFPSVYISDSENIGVPTPISGSLARANSARGASTYHYMNINWPYTSNYNDISQKVVMKIKGGITCCNNYDSFVLDDNRTSSYTQLWTDKVANITVYRTPSITNSYSTQMQIKNVVNPYPIEKETYEQIKKIEILFYSNYKNVYIKQVDQFDYSTYSQLSQISVDSNLGSPLSFIAPKSYDYHQNYPMTYDIEYAFSKSSFANRQLDKTILKFTAGVGTIQEAYVRYQQSPYIVNPLLDIKIFKDDSNYWCLKITGMDDNIYSTSYDWYIRMRFLPNGNTLSYTSTTYAANGQIEFSNSDSESLSSDNYNSSAIAPTTFELFEQRYMDDYYELQRQWLYAETSQSTRKLAFRFDAPYNISEGESIDITIPTTSYMVGADTPNYLTCVIQPTESAKTILGLGLHSECNYSAGMYSIHAPIGGLTTKEYTVTILENNQTLTEFEMPETPDRYEVSFVYNSLLGMQFGDTYIFSFSGLLKSFSVSHLTLRRSTYNMIGFSFTPRFTLGAASLTSPVTQSVLQISLESKYFSSCLGVDSVFSNDGMYFESGTYFSHYSSPAVSNANTRLLCGQYSESYSPVKLTVTDYGQMTANSAYYFRFPLITNPSSTYSPLLYKIRLLKYADSEHYPTVIGEYNYHSLQQVVSGSSSSQYTYTSQSNDDVQKTMSLSISYNYYYPPNGAEVLVKFKNDELQALTSISTLTTLSNSNYNYQYYPNINLCVFKKSTSTSDKSISLGSYPTSEDQRSYTISWMYAYPSTSQIYTSNFNPGTSQTKTIDYATSWSSSSFLKLSGLDNTNSMGVYKIGWSSSSLSFSEGSYMIITIDTQFEILEDYCKATQGFYQGTTLETSNLICRKNSNTDILIAGYSSISTGASLSVTLYLKVAYNSLTTRYPNARIIVYSADDNKIIDAQTSSYTLSITEYGSYTLALEDEMEKYISKGNSQELDVVFRLSTYTLTNGYYVELDFGNWTVDPATTEGKIVWKYKVGSNIYWVPTEVTNAGGNVYKIPVYDNYSMTAGQDITIRVYHLLPDSDDGVYFPNDQWNYMTLHAYDSSDSILEHEFLRVWIEPYQHTSLQVTPILKYSGASTMYEFVLTPNVSAAAGDYISFEFTTSDNYQTTLFSNTLGQTISENSFEISCHESDHNSIVSDNIIDCQLFEGDKDSSPATPTTIFIPIEKNIAANTEIKITILNIENPTTTYYPIGITAKLMNLCENEDINNLCTFYKSTDYLQFNNAPSLPSVGSSVGSHTFNPNIVSATNAQHTFSASYTVNNGDYLKIIYYPEVSIPQICSVTSNNGICYSYPLENTILIKANTTQTSSYSFTLGGMTNMYQSRGTNRPYTQVWDAAGGTIRARFYTYYWAGHITTDPTSGQSLSITFTPTLTPDYHLKYGFSNIAKIQISHLMQNSNIEMIYLVAGSEVTFESYCNATLESTTEEATPYPYRFECQSIGTRSLYIYKQDNFPQWNSNFTDKNVVVYLKYKIADWKTGNSYSWTASAYTISSVNSHYRVSQATGYFAISEFQSPHIYKIDFKTEPFYKRTSLTNQHCMFYGYLLCSTSISDYQISYMVFTLPEEFSYSNLKTYDNCLMEEKNDDQTSVSCSASRNNSQFMVKFSPDSYNHNYKLITIDTSDQSLLFETPNYPGSHYQMKVDLYSNSDILLEQMKVNLTTVYGYNLESSLIEAKIPQDAEAYGIFELKFTVGESDLLPSYDNSASNRITSSIEFQFANSFEADLGTGKSAGEEVACLPVSGLAFSLTGKLTCRIYPSVSTITYPVIIATGFDRVYAQTEVVIRLAGLKTLPEGVEDFIKIGVALTYFDYGGVKGYLYEPTGIVVGNTTAAITPYTISSLVVSESSTNFVGDLVNYTVTGTIQAGFSTVEVDDFVVVEFDENVFEGSFSMNSEALCSLASSMTCYSFGLSHIIYFQPSSPISSTSLNFNLNNIINTAYSYEYVDVPFRVFTLVDGKVDAEGTTTLLKFSKPSKNVTALITRVGSRYGGDSQINYYIEFILNSNLPTTGIISIEFPDVYESFFKLNTNCILEGELKRGKSYCEIINDHLVIINANGQLLSSDSPYSLILTNITNPNMRLDDKEFTITTYHANDVYQKKVIAQNTFAAPEISILEVKTCETFEVSLTAVNAFFESEYNISMICSNNIKEESELKIYLTWEPENKKEKCSSSSNSLYSPDCSIVNEYQETEKHTYMSVYLREILPQKLLSVTMKVKNGQAGTYSLVANISYKGATYLSTESNEFLITSQDAETLSSRKIQIRNYPYNRNYDAIYTIKMSNPANTAQYLILQLPEAISEASGDLVCSFLPQNFDENYFSLLLTKDTNNIPCSLSGSVVTIEDIDILMGSLESDDFLRIAIFKFKNAEISSQGHSYGIIFLDKSTGSGTVVASGTASVPYRSSQTPINIQFDNILVGSTKYFVKTNYTLEISTVNNDNIHINAGSFMGLIILFPNEYREIWETIDMPSSIKVTFGSTEYENEPETVNGSLIVKFNVTSEISFNEITIQFQFKNPDANLNCDILPVFTVSIFDFKLNTIRAQTLSNNIECPEFRNRLYDVDIAGKVKIAAGQIENFTISLEKRASFLNVTPVSPTSAITFEPKSIIFENYEDLNKTFQIHVGSGISGSFNISFEKTEETEVFYNDIPDQQITIYEPTRKYFVQVKDLNRKSVGLPINLKVVLEKPSSKELSLLYNHNCSNDYVFNPPSFITINSGEKRVKIAITYNGDVIPQMCAMNFSISSLTANNYKLKNDTMYITGSKSNDRSSTVAVMRMKVSSEPGQSTDVGTTILNKPTQTLKPKVYLIENNEISSNSANFTISTSEEGTVYYAVMRIGTKRKTVEAEEIYAKNLSAGVVFGNQTVNVTNNLATIQANFTVEGLDSQKSYLIGAYLNSSVGNSPIKFLKFKTDKASNGAGIKIALTSIEENDVVIQSLAKVLRIKKERLKILTVKENLISHQDNFVTIIMNNRYYVYDIVLAPNPSDDSVDAVETLEDFASSSDLKEKIIQFLPDFDDTYHMTVREIILSKPRFRKKNSVVVRKLTQDTAKIKVRMWDQSIVYAVIVPEPTEDLLSAQIAEGYDAENVPVQAEHFASGTTDDSGLIDLTFTLLSDSTNYTVFFTAECVLPYEPRIRIEDDEVRQVNFKTRKNLNLMNAEENVVQELQKVDENLASAVKRQKDKMSSVKKANKINKKKKERKEKA